MRPGPNIFGVHLTLEVDGGAKLIVEANVADCVGRLIMVLELAARAAAYGEHPMAT